MAKGDETGPSGSRGEGRGSRGRRDGNHPGAGPGGECMCPRCGATASHKAGQPCYKVSCPECGARMVRK